MGRRRGVRPKGLRHQCITWYERVPKREQIAGGGWRVKCSCSWKSNQLPYDKLEHTASAHKWAMALGRDALRPPWLTPLRGKLK